MLTKRIIPCLDIKDGRVVKGVRFSNLRDAGDPVEQAVRYEQEGADELVMLDVSATPRGVRTAFNTVAQVRKEVSIPISVGGGVRRVEDALALLDSGADKVCVNTAAVQRPELLSDLAQCVGSQCVVLAIDAARFLHDSHGWEVVTMSGKNRTGLDVIQWAKRGQELGAGEMLLTSWDRDGTRSGYDLALIRAIRHDVQIPMIASGGASTVNHLIEAIATGADAVLAASIFHEAETTANKIKESLHKNGFEVRL